MTPVCLDEPLTAATLMVLAPTTVDPHLLRPVYMLASYRLLFPLHIAIISQLTCKKSNRIFCFTLHIWRTYLENKKRSLYTCIFINVLKILQCVHERILCFEVVWLCIKLNVICSQSIFIASFYIKFSYFWEISGFFHNFLLLWSLLFVFFLTLDSIWSVIWL